MGKEESDRYVTLCNDMAVRAFITSPKHVSMLFFQGTGNLGKDFSSGMIIAALFIK